MASAGDLARAPRDRDWRSHRRVCGCGAAGGGSCGPFGGERTPAKP